MTSLANFKATKSFRKEVASFDGIICHTALASFFTRLAVLGLRKRPVIICVAHGYLFHENASALKNCVYLLAEKLLAPVTDMLLTMNQWDFEKAKKHHLAKEIYNIAGMGVASHASCPNGTSESEPTPISLPCPENALILMFGGEFSKRKNQIFLIEAMCDLPEEVHLVLAGQGEFYEFCQKKVQEKNLSHRVHFLSQVKHLPLWYEKADIIVSASHSEGLPFHLMEAMLLGKATVVSDIKGHRDLINPNTSESQKSGLLFSLSHKNDYVKAVLKLKEDKNLKQQYEQQAKKQSQQWTLEKVLPQVMARYEQAFKTCEKIH